MRWKAVIFDMDGTLLETERLIVDAGIAAMERLGVPPKRDVLEGLVGLVSADAGRHFTAAYGPDFDLLGFETRWNAEFTAAIARGIPLRPGVEALFDHLDRLAMPRALATNSRTKAAVDHLGRAGILRHFPTAHIHGRDHVARPKPAPDLFLHAASTLGIAPADCLVFEDSDPGAEGAVAAGMTVVQVPDQRPAGNTGAHHVARSLIEGARAAGLME